MLPGDYNSLKVSSKLNTFGELPGGGERPETNVTCYRIEQIEKDNSSSKYEMTGDTKKVTDCGASRMNAATSSQAVQRTTESADDNRRQSQLQTQTRRLSDNKQADVATELPTSSEEQQQSLGDATSDNNKKAAGCSSLPNTVTLLADLISKISELATRQDQLEHNTATPCRARASKGSQTETSIDVSAIAQASRTSAQKPSNITSANNRQQLLQDDKTEQDEKLSRQSVTRQSLEQQTSSQINNGMPQAAKQKTTATSTNDDATQPTKLVQSSSSHQQQQRPPNEFVEKSRLSAVTDNIIHIVRGSNELDDLTVQELVRQYSELCRVSDTPVQTTAYSEAAHDDCQSSPRPHRDTDTPQHADNVTMQRRRTTHDNSPQDVVTSASSLRRLKQLDSQHRTTECETRTAASAERYQQTRSSQHRPKTADDPSKLRMQYVFCCGRALRYSPVLKNCKHCLKCIWSRINYYQLQ